MVEWLKSGGIALLRPSVKKMARSNGKGRWKLVAVMQSNCQQNKGVYQQNRNLDEACGVNRFKV